MVTDVPQAPIIEVTKTTSNTLDLKLVTSTSPGDLPVITCSVFYKQMYGSQAEVIVPAKRSEVRVTLADLECGRDYQVGAQCVNRLGPGPPSRKVKVTTAGDKPKVPEVDSDFLHPTNVSVRLDLYRWDVASCPVSYFVVEYKLVGDRTNAWTLVSNNLQTLSRRFTIRALEPERAYELRVRANNAAGSSERAFAFQTVSPKDAGERLGSGSSLDDSRAGVMGAGIGETLTVGVPIFIGALLVVVLVILVVIFVKKSELEHS